MLSQLVAEGSNIDHEKLKTVDRTLTLKIPERFDKELQLLANDLNRTVESILKDELYGILTNWYSGGYAENWAEEICCHNLEEGKKIEKEVAKIADAEDC